MAGITNMAFRQLCREQGAGLYVCEMVMTRALVERNPKTMRMIAFASDERPRSLQMYGVYPEITARAVRMIAEDDLADHIDMNFGCPMLQVDIRDTCVWPRIHQDLYLTRSAATIASNSSIVDWCRIVRPRRAACEYSGISRGRGHGRPQRVIIYVRSRCSGGMRP
jgi:hypothetical protein